MCTACHAEPVLVAAGAHGYPVHYPPYTLERNFGITVGHNRHRAVPCATCHAGGKPAPHQRCAGCHDGTAAAGRGPAMTACTGCHPAASGKPLPPTIIHAEVNVGGAFSHGRHAARGGDGARCATCHRAVLDTDDNRLPAPDAASWVKSAGVTVGTSIMITARAQSRDRRARFGVGRPAGATHTRPTRGEPGAACHPLPAPAVTVITHPA